MNDGYMPALVACCRRALGTSVDEVWPALPSDRPGWEALADMASAQGVLPFAFRHLPRAACAEGREHAADALRSRFLRHAAGALRFATELRQLLDLLADHNITAVPFKGPVLSNQLYGDVVSRQFADLDLLVTRRDVERVHRLLVARGYVYEPSLWHTWADSALFYNRAYRQEGVSVELHWAFARHDSAIALDVESMWPRVRTINFLGGAAHSLSREDLLLALCVHGARHCWDRLGWLCDIAALLRATEPLDWELALHDAQRAGIRRIVAVGVLLADEILGAPLRPDLHGALKNDARASVTAAEIGRSIQQAQPIPVSRRFSLFLEMRERLSDRVRQCRRSGRLPSRSRDLIPQRFRWYLLATIPFTANQHDWEFIPIPPRFRALYLIVRPIRLTGVVLRTLLSRDRGRIREWRDQTGA